MTWDAAWHNAQNNPDVTVPHDASTHAMPSRKRQERTKRLTASKHTSRTGSTLERRFLAMWESLGCPELQREYRFDEVRRWRFDFAHVGTQTAIEIEGGLYNNGRHQRAAGYEADAEKYNFATLGGWSVYRLTSGMITPEWCERIADAIVTSMERTK